MKRNGLGKILSLLLTTIFILSFTLPALSAELSSLESTHYSLGALKPETVTQGNIDINQLYDKLQENGINPLSLPSIVDYSNKMPPIGNQGSQGSCTAWATGYYYKTFQDAKDHNWTDLSTSTHQFSPAFIYNQIKVPGGGSYISHAFSRILAPQGCDTLADFPYNQHDDSTQPTQQQLALAYPHRAVSYTSLSTDSVQNVDTLKQYLNTGDVFVIGVPVYWSSWDPSSGPLDVITVQQSTGSKAGNHAICIVGYDDTKIHADGTGAFKFINSWGPNWGHNGYQYLSYKYINQLGFSSYAMTDLIENTPVTSVSLSADKTSPQPAGTEVVFTASATGSSNPLYQFWKQQPDGQWISSGEYSSNNIYRLSNTVAGTYTVAVYSKDSSASTWEAYSETTFTFGGGKVTSVSLSADKTSPQPAGTEVVFTASATGSSSPLYQFWKQQPDGQWISSGEYSSNNIYRLINTVAGTYTVAVYSKDSKASTWEAYSETTFTFGGSKVTSESPSTDKTSPQPENQEQTVPGA